MESKKFYFNKELISKKLLPIDSPSRLCLRDIDFIKGAVTFLIFPHKNRPHPYSLVLIKRAHRKGDKHSGEMSFPGGKFEKNIDQNLIDTALRETEEELGIPRKNIAVLGSFDDHITPKYFIITPIVAFIHPKQEMKKQITEVSEIVKIPITFFANKQNYKERTYKLNGKGIAVGKYVYRSPQNKKYVIFGATSHLIVSYLKRVYNLQLMKLGYQRLLCEDFKTKPLDND